MRFLVVLLLLTESVWAQSVNSHHFRFSDSLETVGIEDALGSQSELVQSGNPFLFRASLDYARDSLSATNLTNNPFSIVDHLYSATVGGSAVIHSRILIGVDASLHYIQLSNAYVSGQFDSNAWRLGDVSVHAKVRLTSATSKVNVALRPFLGIPTGSEQYLVSEDSFRFGGHLLVDTHLHRWKFYFQSGLSRASNAQFLSLDERTFLDVSVGTFYVINKKFGLNAEWIQSISVTELEDGQNPTQINLGLRYDTGSTKVFVGGGLQGLDFSNSHRPYMFFAGIKQPFGAKRSGDSVVAAPVVMVEPQDRELSEAIEYMNAIVVYFDNDSAVIKSTHDEMLNKAAQLMGQQGGKIQYLVIHGHTDPRGNENYNKRLSEKRARSVKDYFIQQGVNEHSLLIDGYGESVLKSTEEKDYQNDRRVEFQVMKR